jgi:hypothetical protein
MALAFFFIVRGIYVRIKSKAPEIAIEEDED